MSLFSGRIILLILLPVVCFGFALGVLHWNHDKVRCYEAKSWQSSRWYTLFAVGRLEFRYRDFNWDCHYDFKQNPQEGWRPDASAYR